ncbi:MAG: hypothetical protein U0996_21870 [Planctomycetaceae bacterium]
MKTPLRVLIPVGLLVFAVLLSFVFRWTMGNFVSPQVNESLTGRLVLGAVSMVGAGLAVVWLAQWFAVAIASELGTEGVSRVEQERRLRSDVRVYPRSVGKESTGNISIDNLRRDPDTAKHMDELKERLARLDS